MKEQPKSGSENQVNIGGFPLSDCQSNFEKSVGLLHSVIPSPYKIYLLGT